MPALRYLKEIQSDHKLPAIGREGEIEIISVELPLQLGRKKQRTRTAGFGVQNEQVAVFIRPAAQEQVGHVFVSNRYALSQAFVCQHWFRRLLGCVRHNFSSSIGRKLNKVRRMIGEPAQRPGPAADGVKLSIFAWIFSQKKD